MGDKMDRGFSAETVDLAEACKTLARSQTVQALLKKEVGSENYPAALELMKAGTLDGDLGATVHDLFIDTIVNEATTVWSGFIRDENDDWPVRVNEYQGVFWVFALEIDPVGYFLNAESAISFARMNWDDVYESGEEPQ
jgi:predicted ATPase